MGKSVTGRGPKKKIVWRMRKGVIGRASLGEKNSTVKSLAPVVVDSIKYSDPSAESNFKN